MQAIERIRSALNKHHAAKTLAEAWMLTDEIEDALSIESLNEVLAHIEAQAAEIERLRKGLSGVEFLIKESTGVYGLHLTGELSPWSSLRTGGEYETWLVKFDTALKETP